MFRLSPVQDLHADQQPNALRLALQQLSQLQLVAPTARVRLDGLQYTEAIATVVHELAPTLPHVRLGVQMDALTDEQLGVALSRTCRSSVWQV